jgi:DNA-directed RNA polymerase specialized sigma24 family protein
MYFFQGMTQKDMASVLNIPVATLKSRLHAAMKAFKSSWLLSHQDS